MVFYTFVQLIFNTQYGDYLSQNSMFFQFLLDLPKNVSLKIFALVGLDGK